MNQPLVLAIGDLVVYKKIRGSSAHWEDGDLHIIKASRASEDGISYRTHKGAWFSRTDFDLVEASNEVLLDILFTTIPEDPEADIEEADGTYVFHAEWREAEPKAIRRSMHDL